METTVITIKDKRPYSGGAARPPMGDFYSEDSIKYTCWDKDDFNTYNVGNQVSIMYTSKENVSGGNTYTNRNISKMENVIPQVAESLVNNAIAQAPVESNHTGYPESELVSGRVKIGNATYEVILRLVQ